MPRSPVTPSETPSVPAGPIRRTDNLALAFQEMFTVIVRLGAGRQNVHDPGSFRAQILAGLRNAQGEARSKGYSDEDIRVSTFAVVGFLDETILNRNPDLDDWILRPLQFELFNVMTAGEIFYRNIDHLLNRRNSQELADVLEVYSLCVLLGFRGRYGASETASLRAIAASLNERIRIIRGAGWPAASTWRPEPRPIPLDDPALKRLSWTAIAIWVVALCLFLVCLFVLHSAVVQVANSVPAAHS